MIDLEKTVHHRVYKTEFLGKALIVTLQGDSPGFSIGAVHNEMATVIGLAKHPDVQNLVIDLSGSNYYGSLILGEIVNLGQAVRERGGRVALAGTSNDMKEILRMMRLDAMWERYPTRGMALRALAEVPWQQRMRPYLKPMVFTAGVLLLLAFFFLIPRHDVTAAYYQETRELWDDAYRQQATLLDDLEWQHFRGKADRKLEDLSRRVYRVAGARNLAGQHLLYAVRDSAPKALEKRLDPNDEQTIITNYLLALVFAELRNISPPKRPPEVEKVLGPDPAGSLPLKARARPEDILETPKPPLTKDPTNLPPISTDTP